MVTAQLPVAAPEQAVVACPECGKKYPRDSDSIAPGCQRVRCTKCNTQFSWPGGELIKRQPSPQRVEIREIADPRQGMWITKTFYFLLGICVSLASGTLYWLAQQIF